MQIAPKESTYASLLTLLIQSDRAFNHRLVIENGEIGEQKDMKDKDFAKYVESARTVATWMVAHDK